MLFRRVVPWFLIDIVVATISVGLSGIVWRISAVINLGIPVFVILAIVDFKKILIHFLPSP